MAGRKPEVSDADILKEFYLSSDPVLAAVDLTDPLDMSRQGVHYRLQDLESEGYLESKSTGRDRVYWLSERGEETAQKALRES